MRRAIGKVYDIMTGSVFLWIMEAVEISDGEGKGKRCGQTTRHILVGMRSDNAKRASINLIRGHDYRYLLMHNHCVIRFKTCTRSNIWMSDASSGRDEWMVEGWTAEEKIGHEDHSSFGFNL